MVDYHIHTQHSIDASGTVEEYCTRAIEIGLKEICFTNHCELDAQRNDSFIRFDGEREPLTKNALLKLQNEIFAARDRFQKYGLAVKFGIEVGYDPGIQPVLEEISGNLDLDFIIGAIHCLEHICIDSSKECGQYFEQYDIKHYIADYYNAVADLVTSGICDSLAHFDVYKKYGHSYYGQEISHVPQDMIARIYRLMKENDVALEINTAGMRFMNEFYPAPILMELARDNGLELMTIGSDSHRPVDLGKDVKLAMEYLKSYGFGNVCTFDRRRPSMINI